ncbi:unnamed protein product, partial [Nesidiocoris tenuis]
MRDERAAVTRSVAHAVLVPSSSRGRPMARRRNTQHNIERRHGLQNMTAACRSFADRPTGHGHDSHTPLRLRRRDKHSGSQPSGDPCRS